MPVEPERALLTATAPLSRGVRRLRIAGVVVLVAAVAFQIYGRPWYRQYLHRRQTRSEFATAHAKDCAESWQSVEIAQHHYEEAHKRFLDQLTVEDTEAVINRDAPDYLTKAAALHDSLIHARAICPAQADPSRESNIDRVGAVNGVDVRDLY